MRRGLWLIALLAVSRLLSAHAEPSWSLEGYWGSADLTSRWITGATISRDGDNWSVEFIGATSPTDSKMPRLPLMLISDQRAVAGTTTLTRDGADLLVEQSKPGSAPLKMRLVRRPQITPTDDTAEAAVRAAFAREFGVTIDQPAIYLPKYSCQEHATATAYLKASDDTSTLLVLYMSRDGKTFVGRKGQLVLTPSGTIRVLSVLVRYWQTTGENADSLWQEAQQQINRDHEAFAKARGYSAPVVTFANTNLIVDRTEIDDPKSPTAVRAVAARHGLRAADFQIVMSVDMNPESPAGGLSLPLPERFIYVGNFSSWRTPLGAPEWTAVARAAYHHEMAHHWGWPPTHDWAPVCAGSQSPYEPFIVPPLLFGWER